VSNEEILKFDRSAMACRFEVIVRGSDPEGMQRAAIEALDEIDRVEGLLNMHDPNSAISQINRMAADGPVRVSDELFELLLTAATTWEQTEGTFDLTIGPLVRLWRGWRTAGIAPDQEQIASLRERIGMSHVILDVRSRSVRFDQPGVELDLGAIGKGYGVDQAVRVLEGYGVEHFLVHGGTSSAAARGTVDSKHQGWPVGLGGGRDPESATDRWVLRNEAIGCSGQQNQFYEHEGKRLGHVIDPRTGWPASAQVSVSLVMSSATQADAFSTALLVLGREGAHLVRRVCPAAQVFFFSEDGG